ncbi:mRNA-decapping enzyme 1B-like isoform X2 [Octopus sinensis]|uniref:5'-(N(7)-methylguanosine 5'-triphospho)-[mRNA] hydrolase n=1 Tax=Octopus sinensis TaxID=2607531 RepID=A0A7E6EQU6_9MOLL|nr:mRNA-decapping enzyme 1B-like isoform X2 [Octopus sinensis]
MSLSIAPSALSAATATTANASSNTSGTFFHCSADRSSKTSATSGSNPVGDSSGAESRMNLAALLQRDPYITDIVDTAKQVALYLFNPKNSEWERTSIEGTLFVYRRSASPYNGFMILNRLEPNNLIEPITKDLEFQLHDPFLLYRTANAIYGIWFYDKDDCARVGQLINSLVQVTIANHQTKSQCFIRSRRASESDTMEECLAGIKNDNVPNTTNATTVFSGPVDIIQLLCKAQYKYNQSREIKKKPEPVSMTDSNMAASSSSLIRPTPVRVLNSAVETEGENYGEKGSSSGSKSHISLETLFRNATVQQNTFDLKATSIPSRNAHFQRSNMLLESDPATSQLPTILKQFGSSVTMVEDIEKQPQHHGKCENTTSPSTLMLKQLSPSLVTASSHNGFNLLKSSQNYHEFDKISRKTPSKKTNTVSINKGVNLLDPVSFSSTTSITTSGQIFNFPQSPKIESENSYFNATDCLRDPSNFEPFPSSQSSYTFHGINHFNVPDFTSSLLTIGLDSSIGSKPMKSPILAKSCTQELLTPADLESVSLPNSSGSISSTLPQHTNNNLLSPMAFVSQHTKAKSVSSSSSNSPE